MSDYEWQGPTPIDPGDKIELIIDGEVWHTTAVEIVCATQFTVLVNDKVRWFFYEDKGDTWRKKKEDK